MRNRVVKLITKYLKIRVLPEKEKRRKEIPELKIEYNSITLSINLSPKDYILKKRN
jgi:hypothetical protein